MMIRLETPLENYELAEELSQDEVMTIYRGQRLIDETPVIIKIITPLYASDEFFARRFKQIAKQTAKLEHPNITRTYEAEQSDDLLYVVQDLPAARPLVQVLAEEGPFSPQRTQLIARQIASALDYAHQNSVTHGDLSASRIYLDSSDHVFVSDFGQAQLLFGTHIVTHGYQINSPETVAPERVHGQGPSRHADLYALGILCYQMLAGKPPFTGASSAILHAQAYRQPTPLYRINPGLSVALSEVIGRMLSKGVELRYNTAAEFARALSVACAAQTQARHFTPLANRPSGQPAPVRTSVYFWGVTLGILIMAALLVWAGYTLGFSQASSIQVASLTPAQLQGSTSGVVLDQMSIPVDVAETELDTILPTPTANSLPGMLANDPVSTPTASPVLRSLVDTLLPTRPAEVNKATPRSSPTLTATPTTPRVVIYSTPTPSNLEPLMPAGKGLLIFFNPTGHDLIIDLTGPTNLSELIPPNSQKEVMLTPGQYQCIIHTPTGQWLASRTLYFDVREGQTVERDYYTDYDLTLP